MANHTVAVVGGDTLLARDIRELLEDIQPKPRIVSIAATGASELADTEPDNEEDESLVLLPLTAENLDGSRVAILAGSAASGRRTLKLLSSGAPKLIDLTGSLEEQPEARLRAPSAEPRASGAGSRNVQVIAHPASIALTMLLSRAARAGTIRKTVAHVFEPASERGQRGIEELRKQTVSVLAFQKLPMDVYDTQLAFNVLAQYGEEALEPLDSVEQRIERHLASLLHNWPGIPMPSVRLVQVPVFHGHSLSVWVEFEENPGAAELSRILRASGVDVREEEPPTNIGVAGQSGISAGGIKDDTNNPRACWFWVAADNVRLAAENAVAVARELL